MATIIHFIGEKFTLTVSEDPDTVQSTLTKEGGLPVALTDARSDNPVYVNPKLIAYWRAAPPKRPVMPRASVRRGLGRRGP